MSFFPDYLIYHKPEYQGELENYVYREMEHNISKRLLEILEVIHNSFPDWQLKVVSQSRKPAIHLGSGDCGSWTVYAWLDLCQKWINLHLPTGVHIRDIPIDVSNQARTSSPHSVVAKKIDSASDDVLLKMLNRAREKLRKLG